MNDPLAVKTTSPLKMAVPLIAFLLIAAAWSAYWFYAKGQAQDRLARFEQYTLALNCGNRSWGGYPFRIHFDCTSPRISTANLEATADKLRLIIQAWNPNHMLGAVFGPVTLNGATLSGDTIRFSYRTTEGNLALVSLLAENQSVTLPGGQTITIEKASAHGRPQPDQAKRIQITATASQLALDDLRLDSFKLDGSITPDSLSNGEGLSLQSEPSNYLDAIWMAQRLTGLSDQEMNAAQQIIGPLLKENSNKLPILLKDGNWFWGPFQISK
jgi:hypothetical protein